MSDLRACHFRFLRELYTAASLRAYLSPTSRVPFPYLGYVVHTQGDAKRISTPESDMYYTRTTCTRGTVRSGLGRPGGASRVYMDVLRPYHVRTGAGSVRPGSLQVPGTFFRYALERSRMVMVRSRYGQGTFGVSHSVMCTPRC